MAPFCWVKFSDMSPEMQLDALSVALEGHQKFDSEMNLARHIKTRFDRKYRRFWHCTVGRDFGSYVSHVGKRFIYFHVDQYAILLFKSKSESRKESTNPIERVHHSGQT
ncbi:unnamed protein product [Nesidiocoris tenuis]|uniref:Dynein light chain n=1 Tax=Nesidiocoris tenuis TaxID=355587 RepID=A0A6H5G8U7_9HEMI|nr:unnamed protein product [Nesidiocoris tenuis]CAA9999258.1 unnamed protein product [Nesidiocoris tenuis]